MVIQIACDCGETYHADESFVGRAIRCRRCGRLLVIVQQRTREPPIAPVASTPQHHRRSASRANRGTGLGWIITSLVATAIMAWGLSVTRSVLPQSTVAPTRAATPQMGRLPSDLALPTGTKLHSASRNGHGELFVENGTQFDGVVKLVDDASMGTAHLVFVRSGDTCHVDSIAPGRYILRYALGWDVIRSTGTFGRYPHYGEFEKTLDYVTTVRSNELYNSVYEATLHEVSGGNARTEEITEEAFIGH